MSTKLWRAVRFAAGWTMGAKAAQGRDIDVDGEDGTVPGTLYLPPGRRDGIPGWVVLHGITRSGRSHPELQRFARALASSGAAVLVPQVPEWRELALAPDRARPTIRAAARTLSARPETRSGGVGLIGFSFGASQAVVASADPSVAELLSGVVGFGGYADLRRTIPFFFTGEHVWRGERFYQRPDPYGRWLVGANYLTAVPEYRGCGAVARALWKLAAAAGDDGRISWHPTYDPLKKELREALDGEEREIFDLYAPESANDPPGDDAREMVERICRALDEANPLLHPVPHLDSVRTPVHLIHGRHDHLIPYTETLRFREAFPAGAAVRADVTALFAHSGESGPGSVVGYVKEGARFIGILRRVMGMVPGS